MNRPYAIAIKSAPDTPLLTLGSGLPTAIEGKPIHYRQREMAYEKKFSHRGSGEVIDLPNERLARLDAAIRRRAAKGIFPPLTPYHVDPAKGVRRAGHDGLRHRLGVQGREALREPAGHRGRFARHAEQERPEHRHVHAGRDRRGRRAGRRNPAPLGLRVRRGAAGLVSHPENRGERQRRPGARSPHLHPFRRRRTEPTYEARDDCASSARSSTSPRT
jgi:hypothetical protein